MENIDLFKDNSVHIEPFQINSKPYQIIVNCCLGNYLIEYLKDLNAKSTVTENYVDKDYLIDYQHFYCRSFRDYEKITKRMHFFNQLFDEEEFNKKLQNYDENFFKKLQKSYLGFIIIKPVKNRTDKWLIGRTLLKITSDPKNSRNITMKNEVSLFGIPLEIDSLPFQTQDQRVSACATIALWTAINPLSQSFDTIHYSPSEITELSSLYPSQFRIFPSSGLTWTQMINLIKSVGLDTEVINVKEYEDDTLLIDAIKAYVENGIPLIAGLILKRSGDDEDLHAVVISGYKCDEFGKIHYLFIHDDQIGPFSIALPDKNICNNKTFKNWKNAWNKNGSYQKVIVDKLLVPIYHKIRLTFARIYARYQIIKEDLKKIDSQAIMTLHLTTVQSYKNSLLYKQFKNKNEILTKFLPRFLWVVKIRVRNKLVGDLVFDATSIYPDEPIVAIDFSNQEQN